MANGYNGGLCLLKLGLQVAATEIVGQGNATVNHNGAPIELNNKSSGGWRVNLDGSLSTKSVDIDIDFTVSDDSDLQDLIDDAFSGVAGEYTMDFIDYYYEGTFTPVISSETANKDEAVTVSIQFQSSGEITRSAVVVP